MAIKILAPNPFEYFVLYQKHSLAGSAEMVAKILAPIPTLWNT